MIFKRIEFFVRCICAGHTRKQKPDGPIQNYGIRILQEGMLFVSVVQLVSVRRSSALHSEGGREDKYPQMLLVLGRLGIVLMETSFSCEPF